MIGKQLVSENIKRYTYMNGLMKLLYKVLSQDKVV